MITLNTNTEESVDQRIADIYDEIIVDLNDEKDTNSWYRDVLTPTTVTGMR